MQRTLRKPDCTNCVDWPENHICPSPPRPGWPPPSIWGSTPDTFSSSLLLRQAAFGFKLRSLKKKKGPTHKLKYSNGRRIGILAIISLCFSFRNILRHKSRVLNIKKVNNRLGEQKMGKARKGRETRIADVWQKSRDILPRIFSPSSPFFKVLRANSKEKCKVNATQ